MTVDVFCYRVDYNICTMVEWILNIWAEKGVVHYNFNSMLMCYRGHCPDINEVQSRVAGRFDPHEFCFRSDESCNI